MIQIYINDSLYIVREHISILEACQAIGIHIKRFCFHESLSVSGNCRMCLVEIENSRKIQASCVNEVFSKIEIFTDTPYVKKIRENIIETLLINHPLDCPICDQGGECDLQDQVKVVGRIFSKYFYNKRSVENKDLGFLVNTVMTRCIHCTRCIRYTQEICDASNSLGTLGRGEKTEIGFYINKFLTSEISGNVIDICPVGALTSKPHSFKARSWELISEESIDLLDGLGSNIFFNFKQTEINRILPKTDNDLNDSFISDKIRFFFDSLTFNRLKKIYVKGKTSRKILKILSKTKPIFFLVDENTSNENLLLLKNLSFLNKNIQIKRLIGAQYKNIFYFEKLSLNFFLKNLNNFCLILGSNLRFENAIISAKVRLKLNYQNIKVFSMGNKYSLALNQKLVSLSIKDICKILEGKHKLLSSLIIKSNLSIILAKSVEARFSNKIKNLLLKLNSSLNFLLIEIYSNAPGTYLFNIKPVTNQKLNKKITFFVLQNDTSNLRKIFTQAKPKKSLWLNSIKSEIFNKQDIIIPIETSYDTASTFFNLEGRIQKNFKQTHGFFTLFETLTFFFHSKDSEKLLKKFRFITSINEELENKFLFENKPNLFLTATFRKEISYFLLTQESLKSTIEDFYTNEMFSKNSLTLLKSSVSFKQKANSFESAI
jgi:NADH-quinone oxidoreductase subunit G